MFIKTWNSSFCFQHYLFISKSVVDKVLLQYLEFIFLLFMNLTLQSLYKAMFFIHQHQLRKCYMWTFSGQDLLRFACSVIFLFINVFLTNFLAFYDFPLLLYAVFFSSTNITKIDMKKCQNRRNRETRTQNFLRRPTMVSGKFLGNSQFQQTSNFFEV